ncbi:MAG: HD domain-containing protein [Lachnospiraceae bacterium]|nr:HD domain-containing protein [Lachnospiraceae bacterium]
MLFGMNRDCLYKALLNEIEELKLTEAKKALEYADEKHEGQFRAEGVPFIVHPMTVALHMLYLGIDEEEAIVTALLHDVCEDCKVPVDALPFSEEVKKAVDCLTYEKKDGFTRKESKEAYFKGMYNNRIACIVKIFDRCNNISSMAKGFNDKKTKRYIGETENCAYPLMDHIIETWPQYDKVTRVIKYHMESVIYAHKQGQN